jgi:hypothetical protein
MRASSQNLGLLPVRALNADFSRSPIAPIYHLPFVGASIPRRTDPPQPSIGTRPAARNTAQSKPKFIEHYTQRPQSLAAVTVGAPLRRNRIGNPLSSISVNAQSRIGSRVTRHRRTG